MSKPANLQKQSSVPRNSAWFKGPPPSTTPSRSQSPAPTTPVFSHSRRPSALSGVNIKDGVAVPRNNPGAAKQASVSFGSIDDASAAISSSPASAPAIKAEGVKSFGTIDAETPVNGKATLSSRPSAAASTSATNSTTSTPVVSVATPTPTVAKLARTDIAKLFQIPSSAPSSQPPSDTSSPSLRSSTLPPAQQPSSSSQAPPSTASSQPSQLGTHTFTPYRHPQPNSQPPRSPAFPQRPIANGTGHRGGQGGPNGAPNASMPSPRLNPHPHPHPHNGQPSGMPPPPQMQAPMMQWNHQQYYYQGMPDPFYGGYYMQPGPPPHHPPPGGPHGPPHSSMPISPRNPPIPLQVPGTPTLSHATASAVHPPLQAPPLSHPSNSIGSVSSPPPTPSTSRLNVASSAFVPQVSASRPKVTLKNPDGVELKLQEIVKPTASPANNASTNGRPTVPVFRQPSPGTPNRRGVRLESPEQQARRLEEERIMKQQEEEKIKKEKEEQERQKKEEEERKQREENEKKKKEEEEKERIRKEEEEKERLRKEEEEKERIRIEEEEKERLRIEEEVRLRKEEEERKIKEEEEEKKLQAQEEEERKRREEEEHERARQEEEEKELLLKEEEEKAEKAKLADAEAASKEDAAAESAEEVEITAPQPLKEKTKEALRINTSESLKRRPGPLDLSGAASASEPPPSALATARLIDDIRNVQYPEGISSPKPELNANAKDGKFRYDRDFLLQFMAICKEKPDMLPPLDAIGLEPIDQAALGMSRTVSGRHRQASGSGAPRQNPGLGLGAPFHKSTGLNPFNNGGMGNFSTSGASKYSSEERFRQSTDRSASVGGPIPYAGNRPVPIQRSASQGGPGGPVPTHRTRSHRGSGKRDKMPPPQQSSQSHFNQQAISLEHVVPLKATENRWDRKAIQVDADSPEMVDRKVKGLLNKLTMERFDSISDQIIQWANKSEKEKDGRTLIQVIRLVFEKATDEAAWSEMYARLCRKMMEQISTNVQDDGIKGADGKPIAGGQLFRKYLLNRCQEDFERGWVAKEATAAAAASKAKDDQAIKAANEKNKEDNADEEVALYSEEYYAAQKAKRQGLGLIKFIGELFKLQMLTERIMHECIKKLLGNVSNPEEEEIESLCKLLSTVGQPLDTVKARAHMDVYFSRMKELTTSPNVSSRMQFMLQDVIELRNRGWLARNAITAPTTIAQVHEAAAKEKAAQEKDYSQRQASMSRGGSRRGGDRSDHPPGNLEGWAVAGTIRPPSKAGDLSHFGKINKAPPTTFGPGSVFAGKKATDKRESLSRTSSSSNMFHMLQADAGADKAAEAAPQRKRLNLLPRSKPTESEAQQQESSEEEEESTPTITTEMSEEASTKKITEDSKEFFGVRNLDEAEVYFTALPSQHHPRLVEKLVNTAVESKEADAKLVGELFERAVAKNLCTPTAFEDGLASLAEIIDDVAIDAPKAFDLFAIMINGAGLDEERRSRLASKSMDGDKLLAKLS